MMLESSDVHATNLFKESGVTVCRKTSVRNQFARNPKAYSIGINSEDVLVERRVDTDDIAHLVVDLELKWAHWRIEMDTVEVLHQENLTVTLATVTGLRALCGLPDLDHDDVPDKPLNQHRQET